MDVPGPMREGRIAARENFRVPVQDRQIGVAVWPRGSSRSTCNQIHATDQRFADCPRGNGCADKGGVRDISRCLTDVRARLLQGGVESGGTTKKQHARMAEIEHAMAETLDEIALRIEKISHQIEVE